MPSVKLNAARERSRECHRALVELEVRAGVAEEAERLRTAPPRYHRIYDAAEPDSNEMRKLEAEEESFQRERTTRGIRDLYFGDHNIALHKKLIAKDREEGSLAISYLQQEVAEAAADLER